VSLRADIHAAFDEVAPSTLGLAERVVETTMAEARGRKQRQRWAFRIRAPMYLVAVLLLIAFAAGALIGISSLRNWRNWSTVHPPQINQTLLQGLEARPLQLPSVQPGAACPVSPLTDVSSHGPEPLLFGEGPVYSTQLGAYEPINTDWGTWTTLSLEVDTTKVSGPILIRAEDLPTNQRVVFAQIPLAAPGEAGDGIPTGKVIGTDVLQGTAEQFRPELVLDSSRPYPGTKKGDWPVFKGYVGYPRTATGCFGFQVDGFRVDGTTFTETLVVSA